MSRYPLPHSLRELLALEALKQVDSQDYLDWANQMLAAGETSPALLRLAACRAEDDLTFEIRPWFAQTLAELGLSRPPLDTDFWLDYAEMRIEQALAGELSPELLLSRLLEVTQYVPAHPLLKGFVYLKQALDLWQLLPERALAQALYPDLSEAHPPSACLQAECQLFLALRPLQPPADLWQQVVCYHCGQQGLPGHRLLLLSWVQKLQYQLQNRSMPRETLCKACGHNQLLGLHTLAGRRWWLQQQQA